MKCQFILTSIFIGIMHAQSIPNPAFDVVSVKENKASVDGRNHIYTSSASGGFRTVNVPVRSILRLAFNLPETQIVGLTGEVSHAMFDIDAKVDSHFDEKMKALDDDKRAEIKRKLLQGLLYDRFQLKCHVEKRNLSAYTLVIAKSGSKLTPSAYGGKHFDLNRNLLVAKGVSVEMLAGFLAQYVGAPTIDKTGIAGTYDVTLRWTPDDGPPSASSDAPSSIFTAVQEQLGLKLVASKEPVDVLVIDHIDMPSPN